MPPRERKTADEALTEGRIDAGEIVGEVMAEIATLRGDIASLIPMREDVAALNARLDRITGDKPDVYDADGFVIRHSVIIETTMLGDLIAVGLAGTMALPMTYRCTHDGLRSEYGITVPASQVPKPWRLLWRSPTHQLEKAKPQRGRKGEDDDA